MNPVKFLLTYRYAEIIQDLTAQFCEKYISKFSRTFDQMIQDTRSGKQNIVEGVGKSETSKKGEIQLLGVAKGSIEEALADYEDFLRQRHLEIYPKDDPRVTKFRQLGYRLSNLSNLSDLGHLKERPRLPGNPQDDANFLLTLCHMETYLLDRQIKSLKEKFLTTGGFSENLLKQRLERRKQK